VAITNQKKGGNAKFTQAAFSLHTTEERAKSLRTMPTDDKNVSTKTAASPMHDAPPTCGEIHVHWVLSFPQPASRVVFGERR